MTALHPIGYLVDVDAGLVIGLKGHPIGSHNADGYIQVDARPLGGGRPQAHRLVWEAVNGPIPAGREINHLNGVKDDNRIANLELVDRSGNLLHAYRTGLKSNAGEKHPSHQLTWDQVREIRRRYVRYSKNTNARVLAAEFGVGRRAVAGVVDGSTWREVA